MLIPFLSHTHTHSLPHEHSPIDSLTHSRSVPVLAHWVYDLVGWYYCCAWQTDDYDCFNVYMERRPTADCQSYSPPSFGGSFSSDSETKK